MNNEISSYVKLLFSLVYTKDEIDQLIFELTILNNKIDFKEIISNQSEVPYETLKDIIIKPITLDLLKQYFNYLLLHNDLFIFEPGNFRIFLGDVRKEANKVLSFKLITALPLEKEDIKDIVDKLTTKFNRKVVIENEVNKSVIGGVIIKKGSYILDFSIKSKLEDLKRDWKQSILGSENGI